MCESSPRGSLEDCSRSIGSETTSSKASSSDSEDHSRAATHNWHGFFRMLKKGPQKVLTRRKSKRIREDMVPPLNSSIDSEFCCFKSSWKNFTLSDLQAASNNFSHGQWLFLQNLICTFDAYSLARLMFRRFCNHISLKICNIEFSCFRILQYYPQNTLFCFFF
jgi:hypothetical protein